MALRISNLTKYYRKHLAVDNVSFNVGDGEIVGLLGPNGAGKTTILRCVTGIIQATSGTVEVEGLSLREKESEAKRRLAFVPEAPNPYDMLTVLEHMRFIAMAYDTVDVFNQRADALLERFDLTEQRNDLVLTLSKGMKQKLAVVCAFIHNAGCLLFDEPLIGIDPRGVRELKDMMLEAKSDGRSLLISTHMLDTAEKLCDRIIILRRGRLVAEGSLEELHQRAKMGEDASLEDVFLNLTEGETDSEGSGVSSL